LLIGNIFKVGRVQKKGGNPGGRRGKGAGTGPREVSTEHEQIIFCNKRESKIHGSQDKKVGRFSGESQGLSLVITFVFSVGFKVIS
jgi:hypothetical protein